jgi:hypothetical protein
MQIICYKPPKGFWPAILDFGFWIKIMFGSAPSIAMLVALPLAQPLVEKGEQIQSKIANLKSKIV